MKITQTFGSRLALTAVLIAAGLAFPTPGHAQDASPNVGCTLANLHGGYGAVLSGIQITNSGNVNLAVSGRLSLDGAGNITSVNGTASLNGIIVAATGSGTYTISPSCMGTATITTSVIPTVHISFTLVNKATRALAIGTDMNYIVTGEIDKQ